MEKGREEVSGGKFWAFAARNFQNAKTASFDFRGTNTLSRLSASNHFYAVRKLISCLERSLGVG